MSELRRHPELTGTVEQLLVINARSQWLLEEAADAVSSEVLAAVFRGLSDQRRRFGEQLAACLNNGLRASPAHSADGPAPTTDALVMLALAERVERSMHRLYMQALPFAAPGPVQTMLLEHQQSIGRAVERLRTLRERIADGAK